MSFDKGFDFRGSIGFATDPANCTYVLGDSTDFYPTTRNGVTFGWLSHTAGGFDRNAALDPRIAGVNYNTATPVQFQVDLPSIGDYAISIAIGDDLSTFSTGLVIKDTSTALLTLGPHTITAGNFYDATDTQYASAVWPGSETPVTKTFATTTLIMEMSTITLGWTIAHLFLSATSLPTPTRFYLPSTGAAAVSPSFGGGWNVTTGGDRLACVVSRIGSAQTSKVLHRWHQRVLPVAAAGERTLGRWTDHFRDAQGATER